MPTVLVTRPIFFSLPLIERIEAAGYRTLHEPLLDIRPLDTPRPPCAGAPFTMITSRATLQVLAARRALVADLLDTPCYGVGAQTVADAQRFGFKDVREGPGRAEALAKLIARSETKTRPLLHLCGEDTAPGAYDLLRAEGFDILPWPLYKAQPAQAFSDGIKEAFRLRRLDRALFFSARSAQTFVRLAKGEGFEPCCTRLAAIGLSESVAKELEALPWQSVLTADAPTEESMIACLFHSLPVT